MRRNTEITGFNRSPEGSVLRKKWTIVAAVLIALSTYCLAPQAYAETETVIEAESMKGISWPESEAETDSYASDGRYVVQWKNDILTTKITTTESTEQILVRGAGRYCEGWSRARVQVDGNSVGTVTFDDARWATFAFMPDKQIAPGNHTIRVLFVNNFATEECNRDLYVDSVTLLAPPTTDSQPTPQSPISGDGVCHKYAATTGSDTKGNGSESQPYASPARLAASLSDGQTGCLKAGSYGNGETWNITNGGSEDARVTIMSDPKGGVATLYKRVMIPDGTDFVTLKNLKLDGTRNATYTYGYYAPLHVIGDDVQILDSEIVNRNASNTQGGICAFFGDPTSGTAERTLIQNNTVHHCGTGTNLNMHGLYINYAHGTQVIGNTIHNVSGKGVLLYRDADGTVVRGNVIDRVGTGILFGSGNYLQTDNADVRYNVITNPQRNNEGIMEWWETGLGSGNEANYNCLWPSDSVKHANKSGYTSRNNTYTSPSYADSANGDYKVRNSTCAALLETGKQ